MNSDQITTARLWDTMARTVVTVALFLSAMQFLALAILLAQLGKSETEKLAFAACLMLCGLALAFCRAFMKSGAPTWKHKLAVAVLAIPAMFSVFAY